MFKEGKVVSELAHFLFCHEWRYQSKRKKIQFKHFQKVVSFPAAGMHNLMAHHP